MTPLISSGCRKIAATLDLSVRGVRGKGNTKAGKDGTVDIAAAACFGTTEAQILWSIYKGVQALQLAEVGAAEAAEAKAAEEAAAAEEGGGEPGEVRKRTWVSRNARSVCSSCDMM